jgi:hypothetical protein
MFPNPQSALPLPPRPNLERYKKLAKELIDAYQSDGEMAVGLWAERWVRALGRLSGRNRVIGTDAWINEVADFGRRHLRGTRGLTGAQFVIARLHGFASWPKFSGHLEALEQPDSPVARFERAADAIVCGNAEVLRQLLREDPWIVRSNSTREHGATLLHYVAANGVEDYRQKTPANIVYIAEMLLRAGAEIDATANVYGGGCTALGLAATSGHPERAGVQEALLQKLLDHGANLERPSLAGNRQSIVTACVANGRPKAAQFLASRGARLDLTGAAALGQLDAVKSFFAEDGGLQAGATQEQLREGFLYSCAYGRNNVAGFLLERGMDTATRNCDGQTALHWAVIGGQLATVKLLLRHNPPLEVTNRYGGSVLGQTLWSAAHGGDPDIYVAILDALFAAGAQLPARHVPVNARVDAWLIQHGSRITD